MANEIKVGLSVSVIKDNFSYSFVKSLVADLTTARRGGHVQTIGTSPENIDVGDVLTPSFFIFLNLDDTNFVDIGPQPGGPTNLMIRLEPGKFAMGWLNPNVPLSAKAEAASVDLQVDIFDA